MIHCENYKQHRKKLKTAILKSKQLSWSKVCDDVDKDIWGMGYRLVMKNTKMYPRITLDDAKQLEIAQELFPSAINPISREVITKDSLFDYISMEELGAAVAKIKTSRAAGPDRIPPEIVKAATLAEPEVFLQCCNKLLSEGKFPKSWKTAQLVLIQKGNLQKYRPICLLNVFGKLFERVISDRLYEAVKEKLYVHQYGFRKNRSTVDAMQVVISIVNNIKKKAANNRELCLMATLDIRNAFNSAPWEKILSALKNMKVPEYLQRIISDYLWDRTIMIGRQTEMKMETGVPQGSILGPLLWNIFYNTALTIPTTEKSTIIGFADDTAVIGRAKSEIELVNNMNLVLLRLALRIKDLGLKLAFEKTEAVILYGGRKFKKATLQIGNQQFETKSSLKYLGVVFDFNCEMKQ